MQSLPEHNGKFPEGFAWPEIAEFKISAATTLCFMLFERVFKAILPQFFVGIINTKSKEPTEVKLEKMASATYKLLFYIFSTAWLFKLCIGKRWNPIAMGGLAASDEFLIFSNWSTR